MLYNNKDNLFFTSDTHFNHTNCIKYDNRPFENIRSMNDTIIQNWNNKIPKDGIVFFLGDIGFPPIDKLNSIVDSLNGKIILIKGNHDRAELITKITKFDIITDYHEIWVQDDELETTRQLIVMCHYAFQVWNQSHYGLSWHIHGHSHGNLSSSNCKKRYDVGVNNNNYTPLSYNDLRLIMNTSTTPA